TLAILGRDKNTGGRRNGFHNRWDHTYLDRRSLSFKEFLLRANNLEFAGIP
ncbi:unnamed protein product, partial [Allacma fusca]